MRKLDKPNILILMSDEHRSDFAGFAGHPFIRTPHLDRLASGSAVFKNCYTPSPVCVPGRQAIMAGQLPKRCGCLKYGDDLPTNYMTFAKRFSQFAYSTCVCGKLHHYGMDQMQGWALRIGFDNEVDHPRFLDGYRHDEAKKYEIPSRWWPWDMEVRNSGVGTSPYLGRDVLAVQGAKHFIDEYFVNSFYGKTGDHKPLLLKVSLTLPHYPFVTDKDAFNYYYDKVQPFIDEETFDHPSITRGWDTVKIGEQVSVDDVRRATAAYCGMIERMDSLFGEVVAALEHAGQNIDDWIVIYTSDHGEMLGQHGIWMKYKFFEASAKVPLFIRCPSRFNNALINHNASLCDLFATLCDLADIPAPDNLDSRSLLPLMMNPEANWPNEAVSQIDNDLMIKLDHLKYQLFDQRHEVLFDLAENPQETIDFSLSQDYTTHIKSFRARASQLGYPLKTM